ncbi:MAG: serine/threonine protein kinase [Planctomycetes bacterium]|nr:serine/threonine protein kinase [Planctomycetota bacterium]
MNFTYPPESKPLAGYTIKLGIGRGAFGEVYSAVSDGGKEVALKLILRKVEVELRGVRECLNLESPHLIRLYDVQQTPEGESWVVMEYCDGESLEEAIVAHPDGMPIDAALRWFRGLCAGVSALHQHGIVHRDLKPSHVFLQDGVVKIGDYGLAKFISVSRHSGHTDGVGTVHYSAPEIAEGRYGREVDLYALGVMLYEILSGDVPFDGESAAEVLMKHLTVKPNVQRFPPPYRQIIARLLEKKPQRRYQSVEELLREIDAPITTIPHAQIRSRIPFVGPILNRLQVKRRIRGVFDYVKNHKLISVIACGLCLMVLAIGISIGELTSFNKYHLRSRPLSVKTLSDILVQRDDKTGDTVRLGEVASFASRREYRRLSSRYPPLEVRLDRDRCQALGIGNRQVLEAIWIAGYSPTIDIWFDEKRGRTKGVTINDVRSALEQLRNRNRDKMKRTDRYRSGYCDIRRHSNRFFVQFRRRISSRAVPRSVQIFLLDPAAYFSIELKPGGDHAGKTVSISDVADFRIVAGQSY